MKVEQIEPLNNNEEKAQKENDVDKTLSEDIILNKTTEAEVDNGKHVKATENESVQKIELKENSPCSEETHELLNLTSSTTISTPNGTGRRS